MKSHLKLIPTSDMSREAWLSYRQSGIGASEVGTILGFDEYKSSLELFYLKIGELPTFDMESMCQFMGKYHEDAIAELWQYWDGSEEGMIANFRAGKVIRKSQRVNAYIQNPAYPWLFVSLDRKINRTFLDGQEVRGEGSLELKTISGYVADKWEAGVPPAYVPQLNTQMLVCEFEFGEMALLEDGRRLHVLPFTKSEIIQQAIIERTKAFWDNVLIARQMVNEKYLCLQQFNYLKANKLTEEIDKLAPEPDGSLAYSDFLKKKYSRPMSAERQGTDAEFLVAETLNIAANNIKTWTEHKLRAENELKKLMGDRFQMLDFGARGRVYWSMNGAGNRVFRNKIKP